VRSVDALKRGGTLVSVVSDDPLPRSDVSAVFFYVEVTTPRLDAISSLLSRGVLLPRVGSVLPLAEARTAHEMLAGAPHKPGKIVLRVA
jgi:NADPH:quinone reductase-like Zn-dependent oxidoreductase